MSAASALAEPAPRQGVCDRRLIVPLDLPSRAEAEAMVERLGDAIGFYKVGLELLASDGMALAASLKYRGLDVFCDWKLHDIGNQVERAAAVIAASGACDFLTVHAEPQVLKAAVKGRSGAPHLKILGVTVLTSLGDDDLLQIGYAKPLRALVEQRIRQCVELGADGVIVSPREAALARAIGGEDFLVVTPGVRPDWAGLDDQARAATPAESLKAGASHLVCGRPITGASDPRAAAISIASEIAQV
jgi:orotidine-5'-phosphate decarboxylase